MPIALYLTYVAPSDYAAMEALTERADFPRERREQLFSRRAPRARAESLAATLLLAQVVEDWASGGYKKLPPIYDDALSEEVAFRVVPLALLTRLPPRWPMGPNGQPFPEGIATPAGRAFVSLSHSDGVVVAAAADRPIGVDVQSLLAQPTGRWKKLDDRLRHPDEAPVDGAMAFIHRWAAKEAALKATGEGLSRPMTSLCVAQGHIRSEEAGRFRLWQVEYDRNAIALALADDSAGV